MSLESIDQFLAATTVERLQMAIDPTSAGAIKSYLGDTAYEEYASLARRTIKRLREKHLALSAPTNLIVVPGVMGSLLKSDTLGGVWWIDIRTRSHLNDLRLSPDGHQDANPDHRVVPFALDTSYEPFLAAVLQRNDFGHEMCPYDWRKSLEVAAGTLREKVSSVRRGNGNRPVHVVAHSMGGLIVRAMLLRYPDVWKQLGRIIFIATPHYGSPAVAGYLKNHLWGFDLMAVLGLYLNRQTYRSFWGVLSIMPAPKGIYPGTRVGDSGPWAAKGSPGEYVHPCANFDMYQAASWRLDLTPEQEAQLQAVLDGAASLHREMHQGHMALDQEKRDRMAVIVGVGYQTLFRLEYRPVLGFLWDQMTKVTSRDTNSPHREGDGRVPVASAMLEPVGATRFVKGVHAGLPMIPAVYNDVFRWLREEEMELPRTKADALSEHLGTGQGISETPHVDGTARADLISEDPGFLVSDPPGPERIQEIQRLLRDERLPEFTRLRLL